VIIGLVDGGVRAITDRFFTVTSDGNGGVALIDSSVDSVGTVVATKATGNGDHSLVIENLSVTNSGSTVVASGSSILTGSVADTWVYGNAYVPGGPSTGAFQGGTFYTTPRPAALLTNGKYFLEAPPTYQQYGVNQVVNIKSVPGLKVYGDGKTVKIPRKRAENWTG
jgi:glucan 1,3-beta-glucosidase